MKSKSASSGVLLILLAGIFWGSMGLFVRHLQALGFSAVQITAVRLRLAALVFCLLLLLRDRQGFRIRLKDVPLFLGLGLGSILFFTVCYFTAITLMPLATAAILLYTSPIWVTLLAVPLFHEKLSAVKLLALALAFGGCVLVSGLGGGSITLPALLIGLGAGLGYGLYSILGTVALRRYAPLTVTAWTLTVAGLGSCLLASPAQTFAQIAASASPLPTALFFVLMALVTAVGPFLCYTLGLRTVEPGRAAIFATVEPMVAALLGILVFREPLTLTAALGVALILAAVVLLNRSSG
ncbi:MAG: DMT family transporter [Eubacteriales bacterium]|nr:DMT family transporter [Eubacteriales bacterium]